jgi:hypothetical protein
MQNLAVDLDRSYKKFKHPYKIGMAVYLGKLIFNLIIRTSGTRCD